MELRKIDKTNLWEILDLSVNEEQTDFVDPQEPRVAAGNYCIWRFMIGRSCQRQGLGRRALALSLEYLRTFPCGRADCCWLSYEPDNQGARALYRSAGFAENGERCGEEIVAVKRL